MLTLAYGVELAARNADSLGGCINGNAHSVEELLLEDFPGVRKGDCSGHCQSFLMVIDELYFVHVTVEPCEANAVLIIDTNGELSLPVPFERFETIAWRHFQVEQVL